MKKVESKNCNLKFEELEEVQEFSFESAGVTIVSVTTIILVLCQFFL